MKTTHTLIAGGIALIVAASFLMMRSHAIQKPDGSTASSFVKMAQARHRALSQAVEERQIRMLQKSDIQDTDRVTETLETSSAASLTRSRSKALESSADLPLVVSNTHSAEQSLLPKQEASLRTYRVPLIYSLPPQELAGKVPILDAAAVDTLKKAFEKSLDDSGQLAEDDPQYEEKWRKAELTLEQKMRLWYGWNAWSAYQHAMLVDSMQQAQAN